MVDEQRDKSAFNMAVSYLYRLNALFYTADNAAITLDIYTWYHTLLSLYRELSTEMLDKEIDKAEADIKDMHPDVMKAVNNQAKKGVMDIPPELYQKLHQFEMSLRKITKKSGLLLKTADDPAFALGR